MSATYNLEPNPTAKVLLHTTRGDLEIELFAKQTPITSRNFLQLCLDGYYDNTVFHRLVKGFIIQGGDPTGTGQGGESSFDGEPFQDEMHSRLKYTRRGLLGMANTGKKDDNGSQFFFTLAATPELQDKNTMFGRIAGDTIYNLMKMAEAEIAEGSEDRPMYPTKVTGSEIILNPFEDMVKRERVAQRTGPEAKKIKKPKRKAGKNVLSFGGEEGEDTAPVLKKAKFNTKLVSAGEEQAAASSDPPKTRVPESKAIPIRKPSRKSPSRTPSPKPAKTAPRSPPREKARSPPRELSPESEKKSKMDRVNAQIAELKASMKRNTGPQHAEQTKKKSLLESMVPTSTTRGRKRGAGGNAAQEQATLDILSKFKSKLEATEPAAAPKDKLTVASEDVEMKDGATNGRKVDEEDEAICDLHFIAGCQSCKAWDKEEEEESDDDAGWMSHSLSFAKDRLGKDLEWKRKNEEELLVIDPLEEAKRHKADAKGKREWDGGKDKKKLKV
ncbi:Peptidylprolyl isomerase [Ascochyta rabiei]|uniref:Peptidyl-prolyl cis-trans isomerase n=1 Tax=Didymella rabiei TaxID=5454 RepID=A0A163M057_DIDRA|nr:Peptidylprolyl isomerase [Ascochyta rabiei]KZM28279.1 peptidyl-prolyl cis-trans isomerase [Ascochyta rabiei]UPX12172.1 Peptidylprolyl isomerase [Ascochyta rabiei]